MTLTDFYGLIFSCFSFLNFHLEFTKIFDELCSSIEGPSLFPFKKVHSVIVIGQKELRNMFTPIFFNW